MKRVCIGLLISFVLVSAKADPTEQEIQQAFAWMGTLDMPNVQTAKFVRAMTRGWEKEFEDGFLLEDAGQTFSIWSLCLDRVTFSPTPEKNKRDLHAVFYKARDFEADARAELDRLRKGKAKTVLRYGNSEREEVFILAWFCSQRGLDQLARDLAMKAVQLAPGFGLPTDPEDLMGKLQNDLGSDLTERATCEFVIPEISRAKLLETFRALARDIPRSPCASNVAATVEILTPMVAEDKVHQSPVALAQLPVRDQVAELIFQLRDQAGGQFTVPGACDIFADERKEKSPAHQLVKLGYAAVPQLIEALDDQRLSRSICLGGCYGYFSHSVVRVGDCVREILSRIANRQFYGPQAKEAAVAWWNEVQASSKTKMTPSTIEQK